jgi:hypothetical protein
MEHHPASPADVEAASRRIHLHRVINVVLLVGGIVLLVAELACFDRLVAWFDTGLALGIVVATVLGIPMTLAMRFVVTADRRAKDRQTSHRKHRG